MSGSLRKRVDRATEARVRAALCDEPVDGFDLEEHARNIAAAVTVARRAAAAAEAQADLAVDLQAVARARS